MWHGNKDKGQCSFVWRHENKDKAFLGLRTHGNKGKGWHPIAWPWEQGQVGPLFAHRNKDKVFLGLRAHWRETSRSHHISKGWRSHKHTPCKHLEIHHFKSPNLFSKDELWWYSGKQYFNCIAPDAATVCHGWLCHFLDHIIWHNLPGDDHMLVNSDQNLCSRWIFCFKCCICHLATGHNSCFVFNSLCKINTPSTYEPPTAQPASQRHCLPAACGISKCIHIAVIQWRPAWNIKKSENKPKNKIEEQFAW